MFKRLLLLCVLTAYFFPAYIPVVDQAFSVYGETEGTAVIEDSLITLLNWNIHKEVENDFWQKECAELISTYSPDIITFQEAKVASSLNSLFQNGEFVFAPNVTNNNGSASGVLTASKSESITRRVLTTKDREPLLATPKISLLTTYSLMPSQEILKVVNVHAINFVTLEKFKRQLEQIEESLSAHAGPILLTGDFNTWKKERFRLLEELAGRLSLKQVRFSKEDQGHVKSFMDNPLDHIYFSEHLELYQSSADVVKGSFSSDHKPIVASFRLKERTAKRNS